VKEDGVADDARELARRTTGSAVSKVDPRDEPSAEWGWHGTFPRGTRIAAFATGVILLLMLIGNHTGETENLYLIFTAAIIFGALILDAILARHRWRR
jgi:Protein of unknown function (DUF2631)